MPRLRRGAADLLQSALRKLALTQRLATVWRRLVRHRNVLAGIAARLCWWAALFVLARVGQALLDGFETGPWQTHALHITAAGLALAAIASLLALHHTRIRVGAFLLGSAHAFVLATLWANGHGLS